MQTLTRILFISIVLTILANCKHASEKLPNIVIIFIDDMGYNDIGCFGAPKIKTPHIDRMAENGMRFTDFYVSQAVCSASRASLLTGCYSNRVSILGALSAFSKTGIHEDEVSLAELLKQKDYATGIFGKWHLGHRPQFLPLRHGFDEYFGLPYSNDMWPYNPHNTSNPPLPLIENDSIIDYLDDQTYLSSWYTERAVNFIDEHADEPFFLYLAHSMVHVPLYVSDKFKGQSAQGLYGDVVMELDWSVGEVVKALEKYNIVDNTLIIFTSDNGPWLCYGNHGGSADPLREGKGTAFEGGQRVPCIMQWPDVIPAASTCDEALMTIDVFPTVAAITGTQLPGNKIDGMNILPLLRGEEGAQSTHEALYFYYGRKLNAVRSGKWKLHLPHGYQTLNGRPGGMDGERVFYEHARIDTALYDMENDREERHNVAEAHPEVVERLAAYAKEIIRQLGDGTVQGEEVRPPGYIEGYIVKKQHIEHLARGKNIILKYPYSPKYTGGGEQALVDGTRGTSEFMDGSWQGFRGDDLDAMIDLGEAMEISQVRISFFDAVPSWIFLPLEVEIFTSINGNNFQNIGKYTKIQSSENSGIAEVIIDMPGHSAKYVHVIAKSTGLCPPGHSGEGQPAWLFADEIVVQ
ncbi:MAG: sulfatase-like hydrolase/transferase [Bacteroidota bacterium]|nr:sulfatase-like hydrolase/transferase [Bacteroidota bacterium]